MEKSANAFYSAHKALLENVYKIFYNNINGGGFTYEKLLALWS